MNSKELCLALLEAESEAEVLTLMQSTPEFQDPQNWRPLDGRETNFNVTSNQASDGGKALTELMTNMVDAVLLKAAWQNGVDPKSPSAPKTMYEAVDKFIKNLHGGKLVNLDPKDAWLKDFAQKNLVIGVTGARSKKEGLPCYTFVDNGEGQDPDDFEGTFLSLSAGNKKSIPFVQGKFNMGSSGVLGYCGRHWLKLIVSRRYNAQGEWGWTIMRRRPGDKEALPVAEYFVSPGGKMPRFKAEEIYPLRTRSQKRYDGVHLNTGTVVKLYDYQVGSKFLNFRGSREALNENLVETILPFRILDLRQTPDPKRTGDRALGVDPRAFYGMEFLLLNSHREGDADEEEDDAAGTNRIFVGKFSDPDLGTVSISAIALKRELPGWLKPSNSNHRVFHAVNGQVQFKQTRGYLSQCGFPALKDRVVLIVDASDLTFSAHNEVWKGDREHIRSTIDGERYRELVTKTIKESTALDEVQKKVAQEELERASKAESNSLFQKLVDSDRTLAGLLSSRDPTIRLPSSGGGARGHDSGEDEYDGGYSPTFVRFEEKFDYHLRLPVNRTRPIIARTDVENGYLQRTDNPGRVILGEEIRDNFIVREHMKDGRLTLYLTPAEGKAHVGQTFHLRVGLHDEAMAEPVYTDEITIVLAEEAEDQVKVKRGKKEKLSGDEGDEPGKGKPAPTIGLPKVVLLTRDGREIPNYVAERWPEDFSEADGGLIEDLGGGEVIYKVNYDNAYHLRYKISQHGTVAREVVTEKYILGMRIVLLGYEHAFRALQKAKGQDVNGIAEYADDFRRMAARGAASTVLALAENLPKIVDASSVQGDVE